MKNSSLVILERFYDPSAAYIVRGLLHSYGIESYVFDEHVNTTAYHLQFSVGGVRLMVHKDDLKSAVEILQEHRQDHAPEAKPKTLNLWRFLVSLALTVFSGAPTPLKKRRK